MKYLIAFLFMLSFNASAATRPMCYPLINGYPFSIPKVLTSASGSHLFWFCANITGTQVWVQGFSWLHPQYNEKTAADVLKTITRASAKVGTANTLWDQHISYNCPDVLAEQTARGRLCRERRDLQAANLTAWSLK